MKTIVVYNTKTGFTQKYAKWIAEELECEAVELKKVVSLEDYEQVIFGGWVMAGIICGAQDILKMCSSKIVFFAVGATGDSDYSGVLKSQNNISDYPLFYMRGGFCPSRMNWIMKLIIRMVKKQPAVNVDWSSKEQIKPLIDFCRS